LRSRANRNVNGREENRLLGSPCDPSEVLRRLRFFLESFQAERYRESFRARQSLTLAPTGAARTALPGQAATSADLTVIRGRIFDVAVDLRAGSAAFGRWYGVELSDEGARQLYMAPGFAHCFCVLSEFADLHYRVSRLYDKGDEGGLLWNDRDLGIDWPIARPIVSECNSAYPALCQLDRESLPHVAV
jgi:dTDP-4-dehydrorhamnose 3,5-epimerase